MGSDDRKPHVITADITAALLRRHQLPEWASFVELSVATGTRRIDLWTINCYASKCAVSYEVKATRADWLKELEDPNKRQIAEQCSNEAWFAAPAGIIKELEVPENWGLMTYSHTAQRFRRVKVAPHRKLSGLPPSFVAYVTRCIHREHDRHLRPEVPKGMWKVAGQNLSPKEFLETYKDAAGMYDADSEQRKREIIREYQREDVTFRRYKDAYDALRRVCGRNFRESDPAKALNEWAAGFVPSSICRSVKERLEHFAKQCSELAEWANGPQQAELPEE